MEHLAEEKLWPEIAVQLLKETQEVRNAQNRMRVEVKGEIAELRKDLAVHKVTTGFWSGIAATTTTIGTIVIAWAIWKAKGG